MKRFTVVWMPDVADDLLNIWLSGPRRSAITAAANEIDRILANDPFLQDQLMSDRLISLNVPPLEVLYEVLEPDRLVRIVAITEAD